MTDKLMTLAEVADLLNRPPGEGPDWYIRRDMAASIRAAIETMKNVRGELWEFEIVSNNRGEQFFACRSCQCRAPEIDAIVHDDNCAMMAHNRELTERIGDEHM